MPKDLFGDEPAAARQYSCPDCHKPMQRRVGKRGPFWGCTGFPECRTTLFDKDGKPSKTEDERFSCPVCTRPLIRAENSKGFYWYCVGYNKGCKTRLKDDNGVPAESFRCTYCGQLLRQRTGKNGKFWGCSQFPECRHTWPDENGKPKFEK
ncbi:MAG: topoisomerase DNA-binding C4 zinc finger domain-containing protein [Pseudohongiellaceae bacterium]|nr:topoisomerase DNA-binding C4 zinc finger domain-containing protein [Pseudohongiellaceae bacterium]